jgi:hypothetical protein
LRISSGNEQQNGTQSQGAEEPKIKKQLKYYNLRYVISIFESLYSNMQLWSFYSEFTDIISVKSVIIEKMYIFNTPSPKITFSHA